MVTTGLFTYAVLSPINGYIGGGLYSRMGGETWIKVQISNFELRFSFGHKNFLTEVLKSYKANVHLCLPAPQFGLFHCSGC